MFSKKKIVSWFILLIVILVIIIGIIYYYFIPIKNFNVNYYSRYSSSSGDRILNINYLVENGEIISCTGTYQFNGTPNVIEQCDVNKLNNNEYNVFVPNEYPKIAYRYTLSKEETDGPKMYSYRIIR